LLLRSLSNCYAQLIVHLAINHRRNWYIFFSLTFPVVLLISIAFNELSEKSRSTSRFKKANNSQILEEPVEKAAGKAEEGVSE